MQRLTISFRLGGMTLFSATGWRTTAVAGLLLALTACATTDGVAVRGSATGAATGTVTTATTALTPTSPVGPPTCGGTKDHLTTPTGAPILTVTAGANLFEANWAVEPLSLAVYADGTAISSLGVGTANKPLPGMTIGYIPPCTLEWAERELLQLATVELGQPNITDQGFTEVTYHPVRSTSIQLSAYALGIGDHYVKNGTGRARLNTLLAALRAPLAGAVPWTPTSLLLIEQSAGRSYGPALAWPGAVSLDEVLKYGPDGSRCGVVEGADAAAVVKTLGDHAVASRWSDDGRVTGLNIGALVPGQSGC